MSEPKKSRMTAPQIRSLKGTRRIGMLTAYDYPSSRIVDSAGCDIILVGDSLGMVVLGEANTLGVTLEIMLHHTRATARGAANALVVGDMPFLSYTVNRDEAIRNAGSFIQAGAHAVKVEGGRPARIEAIRGIIEADIPVMGHIGLTPQAVHTLGGFKVQGKGTDAARLLIDEAVALEAAGCFSIVLECVPAELAAYITEKVSIPTIGIGAGPACDGQVLVLHDLLGLYEGHTPKFVRKYADIGSQMRTAITAYLDDVRAGSFPDVATESFHVSSDEELRQLYGDLPVKRES